MKRVLAILLWLALAFGGWAVAVVGVYVTARYAYRGWEIKLLGLRVDPVIFGVFTTAVGTLAIAAAWLLAQRWRG